MNRSACLIILISFCVFVEVRNQKVTKTKSDSMSIFKSLLGNDQGCSFDEADDWLKGIVEDLPSKLREIQLSDKSITFSDSPLLNGAIKFVNLKLSTPASETYTTTKIATMIFNDSNIIIDTDFKEHKLTVVGEYDTKLNIFGGAKLYKNGDFKAEFKFEEWSHKFSLKYHFYPLELKVEDVSSTLKLSTDTTLTFDNLISKEEQDPPVDDPHCLNEVLNAEISTSFQNYIKEQQDRFVEEINEEFERIIKQIINSLQPDPEPAIPLPGVKPTQSTPYSVKESLSQIIASKVNEEFENLLKNSNATERK